MAEPWLEYKNFFGVNNLVTDPLRIPTGTKGTYLEVGENVDIDDERMLHRRQGFNEIKSGNIHSLWSNGEYCFFCEDGSLKRLHEDYSTEIILSPIKPEEKINFVDTGGVIVFSSRSIVGFIEDGRPYPFPEPDLNFKRKMVGGHLIEFYNSRLYAAQGTRVFFSDANHITRMDMRKNFLQFNGWITMLKSVGDGIYVGAGNDIYFLLGGDPLLEGGFLYNKVLDSGVIEGSVIKVDGEDIGQGLTGTVVLWASEDGIYMGLPGGLVKNLTDGVYGVKSGENATAIYRFDRGYGQYLCVYETDE